MAFYAARQPILDNDKELIGYELLFRTSLENVFPDVDEEKATSKMVEGLYLSMGLDRIAEGKSAFINFTRQSLLSGHAELLPKDKVTVEILESVRPTKAIYSQMRALYEEGYTLALDDFVHSELWEPFYPLCQIIKVDCLHISDSEIQDIVAIKQRHPHIKLLAEKVETNDEFCKYQELGFDYYQGYFFARPEVIKSVNLTGAQTSLSSLLNEINQPEPNLDAITELFQLDPALSVKLLRYTQSPIFKRAKKIESIRQAIVMLGRKELERFIMLLFAATFAEDKPNELIRLSLHRAKFCEEYAELTKLNSNISSAFLAGMLSLLDAMLDANLASIVSNLPLTDEIKLALVRHQGWLAECLAICKGFESGDWAHMQKTATDSGIALETLQEVYLRSGEWAEKRLEALK